VFIWNLATVEALPHFPTALRDGFGEWFAESRVVDPEGKPRVCYKGAASGPLQVHSGTGLSHAALERAVAERFSGEADRGVHEVYVRAVRPFDYREPADLAWITAALTPRLDEINAETQAVVGNGYGYVHEWFQIEAGLAEGAYQVYELPLVVALLRDRGHDAFYVAEDAEGHLSPNIAVFADEQFWFEGADAPGIVPDLSTAPGDLSPGPALGLR
jgi:hypothetical protein